jgi:hypothetical protein
MPAPAESVRNELDLPKGRDFTLSRRCLHVVVGVLRRSGGRLNRIGWRLTAKMAEGPSRNF